MMVTSGKTATRVIFEYDILTQWGLWLEMYFLILAAPRFKAG